MKVALLSRVEFAAQRRSAQDKAIEDLQPAVERALSDYGDKEDWWRPLLAPVRDLFNATLESDSGGDVTRDVRAWAQLSAAIRRTLPKTGQPEKATAERIASWLAVTTINAAAMSAAAHDTEFVVVEWVTMHDSHVRTAHKSVDGQQRPPGETFDVEGHPMRYPGDARAPIDLWINCRCAVRPAMPEGAASVTDTFAGQPDVAEEDEAWTSRVIVALPAKDDPVWEASADGDPHLTLIWLGYPEENAALDMDGVRSEVEVVARDLPPMTVPVTGIDQLGDDGATVWMLAEDRPTWVRSDVLTGKTVRDGYEAVKQFPHFTPHVTIGYNLMLSGDGVETLSEVQQIVFDRIAVWDGENRTEYPLGGSMTATAATEADSAPLVSEPLHWHGVLAPEGVWSGDGRKFAEGALRARNLPLPLTWQKVSDSGHDGSVTVAKIEKIFRRDGLVCGEGTWLTIPESDEAVGLVSEFGRYGVSVDADDASFEFEEDDSGGKVTFTDARVSSAAMVAIPAFQEAYVSMGTWAEADAAAGQDPQQMPPSDVVDQGDVCDPESPDYDQALCDQQQAAASTIIEAFVSDKPWSDFTQADYTDEQWYSACVLHKNGTSRAKSDNGLPIKEPGGALNRNGVHAAAARFNQVQASPEAKAAAKSALRGAYKTLGEDPPDAIKASTGEIESFRRGPGWITNPEDTRRIHDYWTVPGHEGYAKVGWGTPGDFARCKALVGEKIAKNSPEDMRFLNQICSQWHHDATGFWPGHAPAERAASIQIADGVIAPSLTLVSAAGALRPPAEWFIDPQLSEVTPLTVTEEGRVFGHIASWGQCHVGYSGVCTEPPHSETDYAYFKVGQVLTDAGPVSTGTLTIGGGHADNRLRMRPAMAHYDDVGTGWASVNCGEDEHGIWVAGWVKPGTDEETIVLARSVPPSGDWREVAGTLEMIACHQVNTPGFPVPRTSVTVHNGEQIALVAAGVVEQHTGEQVLPTNPEEFARRVIAEMRATDRRREKMAALRQRVSEGADV